MTSTETHYAQIEKEALALTWACKRFSMYLPGRFFLLETDHKPLISLLSTKNLENLPPRILQFRLHMMRHNFSIVHVPGKALITADNLPYFLIQLIPLTFKSQQKHSSQQ